MKLEPNGHANDHLHAMRTTLELRALLNASRARVRELEAYIRLRGLPLPYHADVDDLPTGQE